MPRTRPPRAAVKVASRCVQMLPLANRSNKAEAISLGLGAKSGLSRFARPAESRRVWGRAPSRRFRRVLAPDFARQIAPQPLVQRAEGGMRASANEVTRTGNRDRIPLHDARA